MAPRPSERHTRSAGGKAPEWGLVFLKADAAHPAPAHIFTHGREIFGIEILDVEIVRIVACFRAAFGMVERPCWEPPPRWRNVDILLPVPLHGLLGDAVRHGQRGGYAHEVRGPEPGGPGIC